MAVWDRGTSEVADAWVVSPKEAASRQNRWEETETLTGNEGRVLEGGEEAEEEDGDPSRNRYVPRKGRLDVTPSSRSSINILQTTRLNILKDIVKNTTIAT
jgi:hypothetical protein